LSDDFGPGYCGSILTLADAMLKISAQLAEVAELLIGQVKRVYNGTRLDNFEQYTDFLERRR
jgi:hypothetical protein